MARDRYLCDAKATPLLEQWAGAVVAIKVGDITGLDHFAGMICRHADRCIAREYP